MGQGSKNPVVLSIVTNGARVLRKWKIKINMITCNSLDMAPSGCLQYYRSATDVIRSFNFGPKVCIDYLPDFIVYFFITKNFFSLNIGHDI